MGTIPSVQLFRNSNIISGRSAAIDTLERKKEYVPDGGLILATYSSDNGVKTLLGIVRNGGGTNVQLTVIDVEGAAEKVQSAITSAINSLNKGDAEVEGQYVTSVSEDKGIITVTRKDLPSLNKTSDSGKAITAITQTKGLVSVEFGGVAAANVSVADSTGKFDSDNVEGALLEIKTSLDNAIGTGGSVETQIANAINGISGTTEITDGKVITAISQTKGKVSVSTATLSADNVAFTSSDAAFTSNNVSAALDALYAQSGKGSKVTLEDAKGSEGSNVLKVYTIKQGGTKVGEINIPKDLVVTRGSVVKGTWVGNTFTEDVSGSGTALKLVIANQEAPVYINTLDLVKDHTAGNGIAISDTNVISVQVADGSEEFLSVGKSGVKLSGVKDAINKAAASATTKVVKTDGGSHVTVTPSKSDVDGSVTYTIGESDIASANALTAETNARESADTALSNRLGDGVTSDSTATAQFAELSSKLGTGVTTVATETVTAQLQALSGSSTSDTSDTISVIGAKKYTDAKIEALDLTQVGGADKVITTISQADGKVSASAIDLTASNVKANASSSSATAVAVDGATVEAQIASLATSIKSASTAAAAAHTVVNAKPSGHVTVEVSNDGSHDVVTITENDIASADELAAETTNRQNQDNTIEAAVGLNADGNHVQTSGNYTNGATTVVGEIAALDTQLKVVSDTLGTGVSTAEGKTVTEQLKALSGETSDGSTATSVNGAKAYAKKYADDLVNGLDATITSSSETTEHAITIVQTDGKLISITLGAFDCGTYNYEKTNEF